MSEGNGARTQAWLDGLDADELMEAERVMDMPTGMAIAYTGWDARRRIEAGGGVSKRLVGALSVVGPGLVAVAAKLLEMYV